MLVIPYVNITFQNHIHRNSIKCTQNLRHTRNIKSDIIGLYSLNRFYIFDPSNLFMFIKFKDIKRKKLIMLEK